MLSRVLLETEMERRRDQLREMERDRLLRLVSIERPPLWTRALVTLADCLIWLGLVVKLRYEPAVR